nr:hypothetical protein CFP56_08037 [Quercus suber]
MIPQGSDPRLSNKVSSIAAISREMGPAVPLAHEDCTPSFTLQRPATRPSWLSGAAILVDAGAAAISPRRTRLPCERAGRGTPAAGLITSRVLLDRICTYLCLAWQLSCCACCRLAWCCDLIVNLVAGCRFMIRRSHKGYLRGAPQSSRTDSIVAVTLDELLHTANVGRGQDYLDSAALESWVWAQLRTASCHDYQRPPLDTSRAICLE